MEKIKLPFTNEEMKQLAKDEARDKEKELSKLMKSGGAFICGNIWVLFLVAVLGFGDILIVTIIGTWLLIGLVILRISRKINRLNKGDYKELFRP